MTAPARKLVLAVIDSLKPEMLDRAIAEGRAPSLAALVERGTYVRDCVSAFPSVTPVASASIATGRGPDAHEIPSMNWYLRGEGRYVEYGSSLKASRAFGVFRSLTDTVYNMNLAHLSRGVATIFERLDDAGLRTACTTYLIYRGRHRHDPDREGAYARLARAAQFRHPVWGPRELFYADIFSTRQTDCRSTLGLPGQRDQHAGCVGAHLVEADAFDFLLLSLPDNDSYSHRRGPYAQVTSIATADAALARMFEAGGGIDAFLAEHAMIVMSDHSQTSIDHQLDLVDALDGYGVLRPDDTDPDDAQIAVSPNARAGAVYILDLDRRDELAPAIADDLIALEGVDLVARAVDGVAEVRGTRGRLRFRPGDDLLDRREAGWTVEGDLATLDLSAAGRRLDDGEYPDALGRLWEALACFNSGDLLLSCAPGWELLDWGGSTHVGGGSHGSLDRGDSHGALVLTGLEPVDPPAQWTLRDVAPLIARHFGIAW